jgi:hypothetical protein
VLPILVNLNERFEKISVSYYSSVEKCTSLIFYAEAKKYSIVAFQYAYGLRHTINANYRPSSVKCHLSLAAKLETHFSPRFFATTLAHVRLILG